MRNKIYDCDNLREFDYKFECCPNCHDKCIQSISLQEINITGKEEYFGLCCNAMAAYYKKKREIATAEILHELETKNVVGEP